MSQLVSRIREGAKIAREDVVKPIIGAVKGAYKTLAGGSGRRKAAETEARNKARSEWNDVWRGVEDPEPKNPMSPYKQARSNYYQHFRE